MSYNCQHGTRVKKNGISKTTGRPWVALMCVAKKDDPTQCSPIWCDENGQPKANTGSKKAVSTSNEEITALLREINNTLSMMFAWMKLKGGTVEPKPYKEPAEISYAVPGVPQTANMGEADIDPDSIPF